MKNKKREAGNKTIHALISQGKRMPMPMNIEPMLATLASEPVKEGEKETVSPGWYYEMKWDGYRALAYMNKGKVDLYSRNQKSFNEKFYPLPEALKQWGINAVVDGEIVVVNEQGIPDFSALQLWRSEDDGQLLYYIFDILWLDGCSVTQLPLEKRRQLLRAIFPENLSQIRLSESLEDSGEEAFRQAQSLHLEGIMAKKAGSVYTIGKRTKDWLKIKTEKRQELVIGGYTKNE
jgi:bifunctional non-homologous end joining protein LigD